MMKTKFICFFLLISLMANAQCPDWIWAKSANGSHLEYGQSICTDINGNVYVIGSFQSPTIIFENITLTNSDSAGNTSDVFLVKYNTSGNVVWAKRAGGPTPILETVFAPMQMEMYL